MIKKILFILLVSGFAACLNAQTTFDGVMPDGYSISVDTLVVHSIDDGTGLASLDGYTTYRVYINCVNSTDRVATIFGIDGQATGVQFTGDLFQDQAFGGAVAPDLPCSVFSSFETADAFGFGESYYDSYVTIGQHCGATTDPDTGESWTNTQGIASSFYDWLTIFEEGDDDGNHTFLIEDQVGGGWYAINNAESAYNTWAGDDLQIMIGQFTTTEFVTGIISCVIQPEGLGGVNAYNVNNYPWPSDLIAGCTDAGACNYNVDAQIDNNSCLFECSLTIDDVILSNPTCPNSSNGDIVIQASGGQLGLSYEVVGFATNNTGIFSNQFPAGTYTVSVSDNSPVECGNEVDECIVTQEVSFSLEPFDIEFVLTNPSCYNEDDGMIEATGVGGTPGYEYKFCGGPWQSENFVDGLENGNCNVGIKDANGCQYFELVTLFNPAQLTIPSLAVTNSTCANDPDGCVDVVAAGGVPDYTYEIIGLTDPQSDPNFCGLDGGVYTMLVVDASGCEKNGAFEILSPPAITLDFLSSTDPVYCELIESYIIDSLGTLSIDVPAGGTGTLNVLWTSYPAGYVPTPSATSLDLINCIGGDYTVTITDALGCTYEETFTLGIISSGQPECNEEPDNVSDFDNSVSFDLYPNPSNGLFNLYFDGLNGEKITYKVIDAIGREVLSKQITGSRSLVEEINIQSQANGFYYLQLLIGDESRTVKLVKQN